jgi:hypothetical protein|tara:strand:- start:420 stop:923 length:504 start_codon:yes stop_codon:yes gene_type:complete
MENKKTECQCPLAGYCNRHGIKKNHHYHKLCQNHSGYFKMWEECRGPGQNFIDCDQKDVKTEEEVKQSQEVQVPKCTFCNNQGCTGECRNKQKLPSKVEMAKNLTSATKEHVKSGLAHADTDLQKQRLEICQGCEFYIPQQDRCGKCGCYLKSKSTWKSSKCPIGKW